MRLINTTTLELKDFFGLDAPPYGVLSHISGFDEVSYQSFVKGERTDRAGYKKIVELCSFAKQRGLEWVWKDSCCITSEDNSEAINLAFKWFANATECYAYLSDVPPFSNGRDVVTRAFKQSRWFTRVWTLSELLAPPVVVFLNKDWEVIGYKRKASHLLQDPTDNGEDLCDAVNAITGIPLRFLRGESLERATIAERISWAQRRKAMRIEDMAYSLMGLFGVNMPLLYGEGTRAFKRLQDEIMYNAPVERVSSPSLDHLSRRSTAHNPLPPMPMNKFTRRLRARERDERSVHQQLSDFPYELTEEGFLLSKEKAAQKDLPAPAHERETPPSPNILVEMSSNEDASHRSKRSAWPFCWIIIFLASVIIGGSLAVGLYYSIAQDRIGDGFTAAGWITAVGTLILAVPISQHYPRCKCWQKERGGILEGF